MQADSVLTRAAATNGVRLSGLVLVTLEGEDMEGQGQYRLRDLFHPAVRWVSPALLLLWPCLALVSHQPP